MDTGIRTIPRTAPPRLPERSQQVLLALNAIALIVAVVVLFNLQAPASTMRVGAVADTTVIAQRKVAYVDHEATAAKKQQAMAAVSPVFRRDTTAAQLRQREAEAFLQSAGSILAGNAPSAQKLTGLRRLLPAGVSVGALETLVGLTPQDFKVVQSHGLELLSQAVAWPFDTNQVTATEIGLLSTLPPRTTMAQRAAISEILGMFLSPTLVPDNAATLTRQEQAASRVAPVTSIVNLGDVVIRRGEVVTPSIMEKLNALGYESRYTGWRDWLGSLLFASVILAMLFWYLRSFHSAIVTNPRLIVLVDISIVVSVIAARLLPAGHLVLPYFLPLAAASTFAAVLMAPEACVALALTMAILTGWIVASSFELTLYYFLTGAAGVLAIRHIRQLKQFVLAGLYIAIFALVTALAFGLVNHAYDIAALQDYVLAAGFNGFVSSTLALGGFALMSDFFGVTTMLQLLELGQPNQPLLRRLMVKAPGTYNHSLILASMVERAAEEVGANSMVAKVGALYHDVGKTANPHCFVENQFGMGNIHDELRPEESARIIRGHVSQGLRLARQFKLPRAVLDAIAEHHGTMAITYFLHRARQEHGDAPLDISLFTYPGPKPQSKETALLMLADGCESAVRASTDHSYERIQETVRRIFEERIQQGQLDESPLTLRDLDRARAAYAAVLNGLYHPRVEYPEGGDATLGATLQLDPAGNTETREPA